MATHHLERMKEMAARLTENLCPVLLLQPGLKRPIKDESDTWLTFDDPELVEQAIEDFHRKSGKVPNLGVLLHPKAESSLICVDIDGANADVVTRLESLGVSQAENSWRQITGKGNGHFHVFYRYGGDPLQRIANKPDGIDIDLLANGYAVVAPSSTHLERDGGGPYRWVEGHSPFDIWVTELEPPSDELIAWWLQRIGSLRKSSSEALPATPERGKAWTLIDAPIPDGARNETLTRIAGWLRLHHEQPIAEILLLTINEARCHPPLLADEVAAIVRSVFKYPRAEMSGNSKVIAAAAGDLVVTEAEL